VFEGIVSAYPQLPSSIYLQVKVQAGNHCASAKITLESLLWLCHSIIDDIRMILRLK